MQQPTKILLVDDREDNLLSMETILQHRDYSFVKATSGRKALQILLKETDFALILMDVKMPNLNGFETASMIYEREKLRNIPIIFITAHSYSEENVFKGYRAGAVDYIYKPINPDLLRAKVSVFIELYRKNESIRAKNKELEQLNAQLLQAREQLADDRTRFLIQSMPHIVATGNAENGLNYANNHLMDCTGKSFEELQGWGWRRIIHEEDEAKISTIISRLLKSKLSLRKPDEVQTELRLRKGDGSFVWHLALLKPFPESSDSAEENGFSYFLRLDKLKWIVTLTDIHDQKLMDEKKNEFIALASHELKTPLASAKAYIDLVEQLIPASSPSEQSEEAEAHQYIVKARESMNRLTILISELLDINKIQQGTLQLNFSEFDFDAMIAEAIEYVQHTFRKHKILLKEPVATQRMVVGDKHKLHQVCVNLLSNAIKYSPKADEVEVVVKTMQNTPQPLLEPVLAGTNGKYETAQPIELSKENLIEAEVLVGIKDHGIGIAKSDYDKIFNKFYRVHGKTEQFQGLGVGLYLSAEIIKQHQGKIWVESEFGKGSTFYFTLPKNGKG